MGAALQRAPRSGPSAPLKNRALLPITVETQSPLRVPQR